MTTPIPDEVLREIVRQAEASPAGLCITMGGEARVMDPTQDREVLLAGALLAARDALRYCLLVLDTGPKGASEIESDRRAAIRGATACLPR